MLSAMSSSLHCAVKPKLNLGYVLEKNEVKDKTQMRTKPPCDYLISLWLGQGRRTLT